MQADHIEEGWWQMPGRLIGDWPAAENGRDHMVALSQAALDLIEVHLANRGCRRQLVGAAAEEAGRRTRA